LFFEYVRLLNELRPTWTVFENVPGMLSSNEGKDFETVLGEFNAAGYVIDGNILDSQDFGVAQRRRRIFLVCVRLDALLAAKTDSSGQILASCAAQILLDAWGAAQPAWFRAQIPWASEDQTAPLADSAQARISTYATMLERCGYTPSVDLWAEASPPSTSGLSDLVSLLDASRVNSAKSAQSIGAWLRKNFAVTSALAKSFTTSTSTHPTTDRRTYLFAALTLLTARLTLRLDGWCADYSSAALSLLTAIRGSIAYARRASDSLFTDEPGRKFWWAYLDQANACAHELEQRIGAGSPVALFPDAESSSGDSAPRGETWPNIAVPLTSGSGKPSHAPGRRCEDDFNIAPVSYALSGQRRLDGTVEDFVCFDTTQLTSAANRSNPQPGDPCHPLAAGAHAPAVAYTLRSDPGGTGQGHNTTYAITENMRNRSQGPGNYVREAADADGVRDFAGLPEGLDSARYRALGNAITVQVGRWIAKRIADYEKRLNDGAL
jgi:site-specific DNA-cytosine methylase